MYLKAELKSSVDQRVPKSWRKEHNFTEQWKINVFKYLHKYLFYLVKGTLVLEPPIDVSFSKDMFILLHFSMLGLLGVESRDKCSMF